MGGCNAYGGHFRAQERSFDRLIRTARVHGRLAKSRRVSADQSKALWVTRGLRMRYSGASEYGAQSTRAKRVQSTRGRRVRKDASYASHGILRATDAYFGLHVPNVRASDCACRRCGTQCYAGGSTRTSNGGGYFRPGSYSAVPRRMGCVQFVRRLAEQWYANRPIIGREAADTSAMAVRRECDSVASLRKFTCAGWTSESLGGVFAQRPAGRVVGGETGERRAS